MLTWEPHFGVPHGFEDVEISRIWRVLDYEQFEKVKG
jgi:hypothetical protein